MNIFAVDHNPVVSAQSLCDIHVTKMVLETAQMLSTVVSIRLPSMSESVYKASHSNHPCTRWAAGSSSNFGWLIQHGIALSEEYTFRFHRSHASESVIRMISLLPVAFDRDDLDDFAQAMPENYRGPDSVDAYRRYYVSEKYTKPWARWNRGRSAPEWVLVHKS